MIRGSIVVSNRLEPINVYVKPFVAVAGVDCLFDIYDPITETILNDDLYFYEALDAYPLHKYRWTIHYDTKYINCEFDKSPEKKLCRLLQDERDI